MPAVSFRLFYGSNPATQEQLDKIESITVEQEIDMAWEARLTLPICTDANGAWSGDDEAFMQSFLRIRVEVKVGVNSYAALIDGPVVGYDSQRSSEPGQSQITIIVHDDSVYLNREENIEVFEGRRDSEIAEWLFSQAQHISKRQVDDTPAAPQDLPPATVQRGTAMRLLRELARRQGMHAYVLPGEQPDQSIGCFKRLPTSASGLPDLVLLGEDRNIETFNLSFDSQSPARVQAYALNVTDHAVLTSKSSFRNLELLGDKASLTDESQATQLQARPGMGNSVDLDQRTAGETERAGYSLTARGSVIPGCYPAALTPYRLVQVRAVSARQSGNYLIHHVTHLLNRSMYTQEFTLKRNATLRSSGSGATDLIGSIL
jgi:hypothetical protein